MAEFALILPIMLLVILGIADVGPIFPYWVAGQNAASEGARAAAVWRPNFTGSYSCEQAVRDAINFSTPFDYTIEMSANCAGNFTQPIPRNEEVWVRTTMEYEPPFWGTFLNPPVPRTLTISGHQVANHW